MIAALSVDIAAVERRRRSALPSQDAVERTAATLIPALQNSRLDALVSNAAPKTNVVLVARPQANGQARRNDERDWPMLISERWRAISIEKMVDALGLERRAR
jgi:ABC-type amino acid transport substrate-binding protein